MRPLRRLLDRIGPHFETGGRLERYQAIYEMLDTLPIKDGIGLRDATSHPICE